jgi:hemoglobin
MSSPGSSKSPFELLGGADRVKALVETFYDVMSENEPALARLHPCEPEGIVARTSRDRFALFLVGWLGGPEDYVQQHGHPRLRMRHGRVLVNTAMRDAWLRSMNAAMERHGISGEVRVFLDARFAEVADFLRNAEG